MLKSVFSALRFIVFILAGHKQLALENAALRQQLATQKATAAAETLLSRSTVLDVPDEDVETMENGARYRTTCYCCEAASSIQAVLVEAVAKEGTGTSADLLPKSGSWFEPWGLPT
jgi:hypothetical protein